MAVFSMENPAFVTYVIASTIMILKLMAQGWMTVAMMIRNDGGLLNPEDLRAGPANRKPRPDQLEPNEHVERSRRIHRNDLESTPAFLACGLLFVAVQPPTWLVRVLMYTFVVARLGHTVAYATKQRHELRASLFSIGSLVVIGMAIYTLVAALSWR